ncbi:Pimeloyl-ACP methyl ester carboxylesterase [Sinosporangium album]|uniref:Pimeloyl-ACP methyl ester carboxylesterase n=1 Tax=Sinosporangium album TaxID=504805 RepID=A0A1G7UY78_9ACTN|nr:alpha/beta hydrolase [Sinosporangium album]SDG52467.1 Pimeloyl-ACP methyl ester carboxylesterase [Sinosporangium album]
MTADGIVLVHGAMYGSSCWDPVLPHLGLPAVAVDLPGRVGARLNRLVSLEGWAATVADAVRREGYRRAMVVAHSLGGLSVLDIAARVPGRVRDLVMVAGVVPREGQTYWDTLPRPVNRLRGLVRAGRKEIVLPRGLARFLLVHDLERATRRTILAGLVPERYSLLSTPVRHRFTQGVRLAYVHTTKDRIVPMRAQRRYVARLGDTVTRAFLNSGHSVFAARPRELADVLNRLAFA